MRRWLTEVRHLPPQLLIENRIGADLGPVPQHRPDGMPRASGVVLPVVDRGRTVYAQLRILDPPPNRPRYLNPTAALAANPRLSRARPVEVHQPEVIVTEGAIDALSAAAAGYRAIAVLSAGCSHEAVAAALAKLQHPLVLAFDADDAGRAAAERLTAHLHALHRPPARIDLANGDLNDALRNSSDWSEQLPRTVASARADASAAASPAVSR
jgi:5S rRNA maturation endonuclease (ribonuclease M5)